ncbi:TfoX/Sxy family protein [Nocardioides bruguierae]|uniref:TfoX/Sxy family protein n=1 Tax=Nocardioides bruguierae TaxID=2945102 RepID=UPI0020227666|nr:TfoX/Sxy family protein [Nocardioides bruguierae]MCL8023893.1 TfoX/Sxy family protein [Nocardioides bruguierae]
MPYDPVLADRLRDLLDDEPGLTTRAMFGGLGFMIGGHMAVAASSGGGLMVRCDPGQAVALCVPGSHAAPMVMRGRAMPGWLLVDAAGLVSDEDLGSWVEVGVAFVATLPPKS